MARIDEEILNYIRRYGPSTPIDIAQKLGANSIIVTAVLVDAVSQNKIMRSKKKTGSMKYYFYPDQLNMMQKKIADTLSTTDKAILQKLMKENVVGEFELKPEEAAALANLEDLVGGLVLDYKGNPLRCWYSPSMEEGKAREIAISKLNERFGPAVAKTIEQAKTQDQKILEQLQELKKEEPKAAPVPLTKQVETAVKAKAEKALGGKKAGRKKKTLQDKLLESEELKDFKNNVLAWLEKNNIDVETEKVLKNGKELELEVKVPTPLGKQKYLVRILEGGKKQVSQDDLSSIGMEAVSKRIPVIVISQTGFAKNAKKYWEKELSDLVLLVSKDDLD